MELADAVKYGWMDAEVVGIVFFLNIKEEIEVIGIMVGDPCDWSVLKMFLEKMMYSSFDECRVPFYETLFTRIGLWLPFSNLNVVVLKHLKISPSQLHLRC